MCGKLAAAFGKVWIEFQPSGDIAEEEVPNMEEFNSPLQITSMEGGEVLDIEATVDTGATYTMLPSGMLRRLGVASIGKAEFELADGRIVELEMGRVWVTIDGASEVSLVIFGEDGTPPLLGAYTLEGLRLAADPVQRRLIPTRSILY